MVTEQVERKSTSKLPLVVRYTALVVCLVAVFDGLTLFLIKEFAEKGGLVGMAVAVLVPIGLVLEIVSLERSGRISKAFGLPVPSPQFIQEKQEAQANQPEILRILGWMIGLVLLLGFGWGLVAAVGWTSRAWKLDVTWEVATTI